MNNINPNPTEFLQSLIRLDTTNPPGNESLVINWARDILSGAGIDSTILAKDPNRPNLIARIRGNGTSPPLLLQGHVDVVPTQGQDWKHPPFSGKMVENCIWGRGALDMKGAVAMMLTAFLNSHLEKRNLPGDVILCLLSDEEAGGDYGAKFLVDEHPELFKEVRYALGEAGGFSLGIAGKTFYPIMVSEKQICWMRITLHGPGGHGSMVHRGGTMSQLSKILKILDEKHLPVRVTPSVKEMFENISSVLPFPKGRLFQLLLNPIFTDHILYLLGDSGRVFASLLHNTVNATIVQGGIKVNVIPSEITLELDGRLLPGIKPDQMVAEIRELLGKNFDLEVLRYDPGPPEPDMTLYPKLAKILKEAEPTGHPIPFVMVGITDARHFSKLGIQTYGFTPMKLPSDFKFADLAHAANERIPVDALEFGTHAIQTALSEF